MANKIHNLITVKNTGSGFNDLKELFEPPKEYHDSEEENGAHLEVYKHIRLALHINIVDIAEDEYQVQFITNWYPAEEMFIAISNEFPELTLAFDAMSMESNIVGTGGYGPNYPLKFFGYFDLFDNRGNGVLTQITLPDDLAEFFNQFIYQPFNWRV